MLAFLKVKVIFLIIQHIQPLINDWLILSAGWSSGPPSFREFSVCEDLSSSSHTFMYHPFALKQRGLPNNGVPRPQTSSVFTPCLYTHFFFALCSMNLVRIPSFLLHSLFVCICLQPSMPGSIHRPGSLSLPELLKILEKIRKAHNKSVAYY